MTKHSCLICGNARLIKYLDLGKSALANSYLKKRDLKTSELKVPLRVFYCPQCHLAQLVDRVDRKMLFEEYAYFSSTSPQLHAHFKQYAHEVYTNFPKQAKKLTVEIASNDGILLRYFKEWGAPILGIDPAKNVARAANKNEITTLPLFFSDRVAQRILKKYGTAGVITANNVLAHTDDLRGIIKGVKKLLDPNGVFVFEAQYLGDLIKKNEFDNTYHEHICYFSLAPLLTLLRSEGLDIFDVKHVDTQGGSLRVYAGHAPLLFPVDKSVQSILRAEKRNGLYDVNTYKKFGAQPLKIKSDLVTLLKKLKKQGKKIVGYGAAAKGNTLLQYCDIDATIIDYIVDNAPSKQETYTPGSHIPIVAPDVFKNDTPDYVLLLAWNYADSIMEKEAWIKKHGGAFIKPVPTVKII